MLHVQSLYEQQRAGIATVCFFPSVLQSARYTQFKLKLMFVIFVVVVALAHYVLSLEL
jgi:hypothetical protein